MALSYDIFIALDPSGPWTKVNSTRVPDSATGNSYRITGLSNGEAYYIMVVAGKMIDGVFTYLCGQPITAVSSSGTSGPSNPNIIVAAPNGDL